MRNSFTLLHASSILGPNPIESRRCDVAVENRIYQQMMWFSGTKFVGESIVFLFAAGPFGKVMMHDFFLHTKLGAKDVILDVGSTLDALTGEPGSRDYNRDVDKNCLSSAGMNCQFCRRYCGGGRGGVAGAAGGGTWGEINRGCAQCECDDGFEVLEAPLEMPLEVPAERASGGGKTGQLHTSSSPGGRGDEEV